MAVFEEKKTYRVSLDDTVPLTCSIISSKNLKDHTVSYLSYLLKLLSGDDSFFEGKIGALGNLKSQHKNCQHHKLYGIHMTKFT